MGFENEMRSEETQSATPEPGRAHKQMRPPVLEQVIVRRLLSGTEEHREKNRLSQPKLPCLEETVDVQGKMPDTIQVRDPDKPYAESAQSARDHSTSEVRNAVMRASPRVAQASQNARQPRPQLVRVAIRRNTNIGTRSHCPIEARHLCAICTRGNSRSASSRLSSVPMSRR